MKFRTDFVTNSSSSSFVCDICGRTEAGFDMSLSEAGMMMCVNQHTFCNDEVLHLSKQEMIAEIISQGQNVVSIKGAEIELNELQLYAFNEDQLSGMIIDDNYDVPESMCPICSFIEYSEYDMAKYLQKKYEISRNDVFAEIKKLNARRKKLYDNEYITYVVQKKNLNLAELPGKWKREFGSYAEFEKYLRG